MPRDERAQKLGRRIRAERSRTWPRRPDFAAAAGISERVLIDLELGTRSNFSPDTIAAVEGALHWAPGSIDRMRRGLNPQAMEDRELARLLASWPHLSGDARRILVLLAEGAISRFT